MQGERGEERDEKDVLKTIVMIITGTKKKEEERGGVDGGGVRGGVGSADD